MVSLLQVADRRVDARIARYSGSTIQVTQARDGAEELTRAVSFTFGIDAWAKAAERVVGGVGRRGAVDLTELVQCRTCADPQRADIRGLAVDADCVFEDGGIGTTCKCAVRGRAVGCVALLVKAEIANAVAVEQLVDAHLTEWARSVRHARFTEPGGLFGVGAAGARQAVADEVLAVALAAGCVVIARALDASARRARVAIRHLLADGLAGDV
jgi:hypothetical protein